MSTPSSSRVWFITGCSSGLGRVLTARALQGGERVIATARKPEQLEHIGLSTDFNVNHAT